MHIYALSNQKGGVGKTTTAVNLATGLARRGQRVLVIDLDPQANATYALSGSRILQHTVYGLLIGRQPLERVRIHAPQDGLDLLPADIDLAGAEVDLLSAIGGQTRLRSVLARLPSPYDYVIIDTPPSLGLLTINALAASEAVIIPVSVSLFALKGLAQLQDTISRVRQGLSHPDLRVLGILPTLYDHTRVAREVVRTLQDHFPGQVFSTVIPRNVQVEEAHRRPGALYDYAPRSKGAEAYERFVEEVIAHA
ncbi:MAG: AAA family ATPase [Anaerolineae bacterium]